MLIDATLVIVYLSSIIILSYLFSIINAKYKIPSVLLLITSGIIIKQIFEWNQIFYKLPPITIELLGAIGLVMITLEAGLEIKYKKSKIKDLLFVFGAAFIVLLLSTASVGLLIRHFMKMPMLNSFMYALPISIISSAIVIPSIHHLPVKKRDFLTFEACSSVFWGILFFSILTTYQLISLKSFIFLTIKFFLIVILLIISILIIFYTLKNSILKIKSVLILAVLFLFYAIGKYLQIPTILLILIFGIILKNWEEIKILEFKKFFSDNDISKIRTVFQNFTIETSFFLRSFFFVLFGYTLNFDSLFQSEVYVWGGIIFFLLIMIRALYLKFFHHDNFFPEIFYMPRGLITILLYMNIPHDFKVSIFSDGIVFFIILSTNIFLLFGSLIYPYKKF